MVEQTRDSAGVIAPPPLIYAGGLVAGLTLQRIFPVHLVPRPVARAAGLLLIGLSLVIAVPAFLAMRRAGTDVRPDKPTTALVTEGPFGHSRNPLYLSTALLYTGIAAFANAPWPKLLLPAVLLVIQRGVIEREERYLERKFGDEYRRYKARVRRWI